MSPNKKAEPQFKLNYFDIIKSVLFPKLEKPKPKASPATAQKPSQATSASLATPAQGNAPQPATPAAKTTQTPPPAPQSAVTNAPSASPAQKSAAEQPSKTERAAIQVNKLAPAFFNVAGILSFIVNIILIVVLVILARELFALKALVGDHLLGGLYANFIRMDQAHIQTNIVVEDEIPIGFSLPISQDTVVTLTEPTRINGAQVVINSGGLSINAPANIVLPAGTDLPVHLELTVPVETMVPIKLNVPVDIALDQTDLHQPFIGLQDVVRPLYNLLQPNIQSPSDMPCGPLRPACNWFFYHP